MYLSEVNFMVSHLNRLLLRIRTDDSKSLCQLGIKYGAPLKQCCDLLKVANDLKLNVIGVR